jgi:hypothetical protein
LVETNNRFGKKGLAPARGAKNRPSDWLNPKIAFGLGHKTIPYMAIV